MKKTNENSMNLFELDQNNNNLIIKEVHMNNFNETLNEISSLIDQYNYISMVIIINQRIQNFQEQSIITITPQIFLKNFIINP